MLVGILRSIGPSLFAFFGLIAIQVTIAVVYKLAGVSGNYKFSQAGALAISEGVKVLLSFCLLMISSKKNLEQRHQSSLASYYTRTRSDSSNKDNSPILDSKQPNSYTPVVVIHDTNTQHLTSNLEKDYSINKNDASYIMDQNFRNAPPTWSHVYRSTLKLVYNVKKQSSVMYSIAGLAALVILFENMCKLAKLC
jgi:hypothetical protein